MFDQHMLTRGSSIITLRVQGVNMYVDRMIIDQSEMLRAAFKSNLSEGLTGVMDLEGDLRVWFVVFLAMYGATSIPPSLIRNKPAVVIIEAMVQADYILANLEVKTNICKLLSAHLETFHTWQTIPLIQLTINDHENKAIELNDAWNAYRTLPDVILKPFDEFGFGLLISVCCAGQVYDRVEYLLDDGLVRLVARATKRRLNAMSFSADVRSLFNHN